MAREYYSLPEAAARLGISRIAVFKRVKGGRLPALRVGRNWAVAAADLEEAAALRAAPPPAPRRPIRKAASPPAPKPDAELDSLGWD